MAHGPPTDIGTAASTSGCCRGSRRLSAIWWLPEGPVALELGFVVGQRNWFNLWKPTTDALGGLLGRADAHRDWHPEDGQITELGLHCTSDALLRCDVEISITARAL